MVLTLRSSGRLPAAAYLGSLGLNAIAATSQPLIYVIQLGLER